MGEKLQGLPIGIQSFESLRRDGLLYVDKTARLQELIQNVRRCFLSRPRRFGKSLTLSTLDAMPRSGSDRRRERVPDLLPDYYPGDQRRNYRRDDDGRDFQPEDV